MKSTRETNETGEEPCNSCGQCTPGCMEGALPVTDDKARLTKSSCHDALGACPGQCPAGDLAVAEREVGACCGEAAAPVCMAAQNNNAPSNNHIQAPALGTCSLRHGGCPGEGSMCSSCGDQSSLSAPASGLKPAGTPGKSGTESAAGAFRPASPDTGTDYWPLKMRLVPVNAPFLHGADILVAADCAAAASPAFHSKYAPGKALLISCPKLDNTDDHLPKLTKIFKKSDIKSCTVLRMATPCCRGLSLLADKAANLSGGQIPVGHVILSRAGEEME